VYSRARCFCPVSENMLHDWTNQAEAENNGEKKKKKSGKSARHSSGDIGAGFGC
jgi:hypothetical protein